MVCTVANFEECAKSWIVRPLCNIHLHFMKPECPRFGHIARSILKTPILGGGICPPLAYCTEWAWNFCPRMADLWDESFVSKTDPGYGQYRQSHPKST
eukprot:scaffold267893_cov13-Tisochrysis_lutea.AAC.1